LSVDPDNAIAKYILGRFAYEFSMSEDARQDASDVLVDTTSVLDQKNAREQRIPDGITDSIWFVDHVHPTVEGHQAIATAIYQQLLNNDWITPVDNADEIYTQSVVAHLKTLREEFFDRAEQRLDDVKRWSRRIK